MTDEDLGRSIHRLYWLMGSFGTAGFVWYFWLQGPRPAFGFLLGTLGSFGNLWLFGWLSHSIAPGEHRPKAVAGRGLHQPVFGPVFRRLCYSQSFRRQPFGGNFGSSRQHRRHAYCSGSSRSSKTSSGNDAATECHTNSGSPVSSTASLPVRPTRS